LDIRNDRRRGAQGGRRAVARCEEAIPGGVDLVATLALELPADGAPEGGDQPAPPRITDLRGNPRRVDNVHEQHRGNAARGSVTQHARSMPGPPDGDKTLARRNG
jgi:hypothetical protein